MKKKLETFSFPSIFVPRKKTCSIILQSVLEEEDQLKGTEEKTTTQHWISVSPSSVENNLILIRLHSIVYNSLLLYLLVTDIINIIKEYLILSDYVPVKISEEQIQDFVCRFNWTSRIKHNSPDNNTRKRSQENWGWFFEYEMGSYSHFYANLQSERGEPKYALSIQEDQVVFDLQSRNKGHLIPPKKKRIDATENALSLYS